MLTSYIPFFFAADNIPSILVIGGGEIAAAKTEALASTGARIEIIAREVNETVKTLCQEHGFTYTEAAYHVDQLSGRRFVIAATNNDSVNKKIAADARARHLFVNVVDAPHLCDFIFPALVRRGPLQIAISSSGISPVLARMIKQKIERLLPSAFEKLITFLQNQKATIRKSFTQIQPRRLFYEKLVDGPIAEDVFEGNIDRATKGLVGELSQIKDQYHAALYLIGTGSGDPDLMTVKAIRLLGQADVVMYDRRIPFTLIDQYARKDAHKINVEKTCLHHDKNQDQIDNLIEKHLKYGHIVARLKEGDLGVYEHIAEEIVIAKRLDIPYHIVPGISVTNGCAIYAGINLTKRDAVDSLRFLTSYKDRMEDENFGSSFRYAHDETFVFYIGSHHYNVLFAKSSESGISPDTSFVIQDTLPYHKEYTGIFATLSYKYANRKLASSRLPIVGRAGNQKSCCYVSKIEPLTCALKDKKVQLSDLYRTPSINCDDLLVSDYGDSYSLRKIFPLLDITDNILKVDIQDNQMSYNPLHDKGFLLIGCTPYTYRLILVRSHGRSSYGGRNIEIGIKGKKC